MAIDKKKVGWISSGVTALGGVATAITVPIVQKINKDENEQENHNKEMIKEIKQMFNAFAVDIREAVRNIYQKIHDTEMKIQENKHKLEMHEKNHVEDEEETNV